MKEPLERLKLVVDQNTYNRILDTLGGEYVYFPTGGTKTENRARNDQIRKDYLESNLSYRDLSKRYGLCVSQICKICNGKN